MKIEKAIEIIKNVDICCNAAESARDMAIQALEKQIPKKIKVADVGFKMYGCPNCDYTSSAWSLGIKDKHCPDCGQRLEW